jgi:hypothetical protein
MGRRKSGFQGEGLVWLCEQDAQLDMQRTIFYWVLSLGIGASSCSGFLKKIVAPAGQRRAPVPKDWKVIWTAIFF